ncbi:LytTR family DNA-binding domain-containing protein [Dehalobacter sp. DCM]|uniref:LytR/AlgR family response regulator transcription factor n=1 Tax=Dehalobacter sp. DCM TaxID=2907827 RepID=UPI00308125D5|nr:LytTR family DNA-binding domain-containing protein [Dehalobacter sp. DCM]
MSTLYKAVIVEDNTVFRQDFATVLSSQAGIQVVGTYACGEDFLQHIRRLDPDIAFLDIGLPGISGIQVAEAIRKDYPYMEILFITADDNHLEDAMRLYASDYITKPLNVPRLEQTLNRIIKKSAMPGLMVELKTEDTNEIIRQEDILFVEAMAKKSIVHTRKRSLVCLQLIRELEACLDNDQFLRSNRSYLINLKWIDAIRQESRTTYRITFQGIEACAYLQRNRYPEFRKRLKQFFGEEKQK